MNTVPEFCLKNTLMSSSRVSSIGRITKPMYLISFPQMYTRESRQITAFFFGITNLVFRVPVTPILFNKHLPVSPVNLLRTFVATGGDAKEQNSQYQCRGYMNHPPLVPRFSLSTVEIPGVQAVAKFGQPYAAFREVSLALLMQRILLWSLSSTSIKCQVAGIIYSSSHRG